MAADSAGYTEGSGINLAGYSFTEGGETRFVERIAPGSGVFGSWEDTATVTATGLVSGFNCTATGKGRVVVGCKAETTTGDTYSFRLVYYDPSSNILGTSALVVKEFTALTDGGTPEKKFSAVAVFANDIGASTIGVYVEDVSANASMDMMLAAV